MLKERLTLLVSFLHISKLFLKDGFDFATALHLGNFILSCCFICNSFFGVLEFLELVNLSLIFECLDGIWTPIFSPVSKAFQIGVSLDEFGLFLSKVVTLAFN